MLCIPGSSRDDPRMVTVSRESQDALTGGMGYEGTHPGMIPGWSQ